MPPAESRPGPQEILKFGRASVGRRVLSEPRKSRRPKIRRSLRVLSEPRKSRHQQSMPKPFVCSKSRGSISVPQYTSLRVRARVLSQSRGQKQKRHSLGGKARGVLLRAAAKPPTHAPPLASTTPRTHQHCTTRHHHSTMSITVRRRAPRAANPTLVWMELPKHAACWPLSNGLISVRHVSNG